MECYSCIQASIKKYLSRSYSIYEPVMRHSPGNNKNEFSPPRWPRMLLRFFLKSKYLEEIEGDMEELFHEKVEAYSVKKARRMYTWEMMKLFRPILLKNFETPRQLSHLPMFRNYFKVSLRGLMRNPLNAFINVFGLSTAIGLCIFAYAYTRWTVSTDQFHEHKENVHLVTFMANREGLLLQHGKTPVPLGEMLKEDFAHIKNVCRIEDRNVVVKRDDKVFHERVRHVDPEFLEMFTFPMKSGTSSSLSDVNSIVLSEDAAIKYFGDENPIGKTVLIIYGKDKSKAFNIGAVAAEFPKARTISFDFLINFENLRTIDPALNFDDWTDLINATFVQVEPGTDIKAIEKKMDAYKKLQNEAVTDEWAIASFALEPLKTLHIRSENIRDDVSRSSKNNYVSVRFMTGIAVFMLILACFNYINIGIATAAKRLKEIGVRKSIGATRNVVIIQFLSENLVITFFAMLVGLAIGYTFFIPGFGYLWNFDMDFRLTDLQMWFVLFGVLIITSISSGIYPALYMSRFQVVNILKGSVKFGQRNPVTKVFLCIQLILACMFITCSVMFTQNTTYLNKRSWGYDPHQTIYAQVPDATSFSELNNMISQNHNVVSTAGSAHHVGKNHQVTTIRFPDTEMEVDHLAVDAKYLLTMGLPLDAGRNFEDHEGSDKRSVVINKTLAESRNWENPIGQQFRIDSVQYEVIGVTGEFHNYNFGNRLKPMIITLADKEDYRYLTLKVKPRSQHETYTALQKSWVILFPEIPFEGGYQEDVWGRYYEDIGIFDLVWKVFAFLAISLAALGLYGLVRLNVAGRTKEFSIRKVLGAKLSDIATNVTKQYVVLASIAVLAGAPLGHYASKWVIMFAYKYHMPITFSGALIAVFVLVIIILFTTSTQIRKVMKANPVEGLKVE